ncbi:uncharacterized protein ATNIH1004_000033 [Aspergillus tanneri]|uniref:Uncharacterized protein n=1 Tax=Aspergillus tanneri TaxID=1220188 RepID=A0A5M9MVN9_9EURO|nr:uncharacterized protein ATNIH1004_000033 [Aspergillus tanneri]KAA8651155.1 hypothetical protein ATNIH1004_000033 [Aspergillus tanneri]
MYLLRQLFPDVDKYPCLRGRLQRDRWGCVRNAMDNERNFVWLFPRDSIPADITSGAPEPTAWGTPLTRLVASGVASGCDFGSLTSKCKRVGINSRVQCEGCYL